MKGSLFGWVGKGERRWKGHFCLVEWGKEIEDERATFVWLSGERRKKMKGSFLFGWVGKGERRFHFLILQKVNPTWDIPSLQGWWLSNFLLGYFHCFNVPWKLKLFEVIVTALQHDDFVHFLDEVSSNLI